MVRRQTKVSTLSGGTRPSYEKIRRDSKTFKKDFDSAMYYVHYELSDKKLKAAALKYAKLQKLDVVALDAAPASNHFTVAGKIAHMITLGAEVPEEYEEFLINKMAEVTEIGLAVIEKKKNDPEAKKKASNVISIQDRMHDQAAKVAEQFDEQIDLFMVAPDKFKHDAINPYSIMQVANLKAGHARFIIKFFEGDLAEVSESLSTDCEQLKEGYSRYSKPQIKRLIKFYQSIIDSATMLVESSKATRKPRQRKAVSADKIVERLKYQKEFKDLTLVSVHPRDIVGAKELWVYNTKTRKLGHYIAEHAGGLGVKGTTILDYSLNSIEKTLRKPKPQLTAFKKAGKVALRTFLTNLTTIDTRLKSRLNEHHILLKIIK